MANKKNKQIKTFISRNIILLFILLFSLIAIAVAVNLIKRSTDLRSFAAAPPPKIEQVIKGEAAEKSSVKSSTVAASSSQFYLASISMKPYASITSVTGLGLKWTKVKSQCGAREATGTDVWMATGNPKESGSVTAAFTKSPKNSVIAVTGISGVYTDDPIADSIGFNTKGVNGGCSGGSDTKTYSLPLTTENNVLVIASIGIRLRTHTADSPFSEILEFNYGDDNGDKAGLALIQKHFATSASATLTGSLNSETDWAGVVVQVQGQPERLPSPTPTVTAVPTNSPSPTPTGVSATPTVRPTVTPTITPTVRPTIAPTITPTPPVVNPVVGIWSSPAELRNKPMSGDAWNAVKSAADSLSSSANPDLDNQDDSTNVQVMAAAIVYARTGDAAYRTKVVNALQKVETFVPRGRTLAWARETGAYAIAADLVGYRTAAFEKKMLDMAQTYKCSQLNKTLLEMYKQRPNNWGSQAFGSLTAIYRYLGNTSKLQEVRAHYAAAVNGPISSSASFGSMSWQCSTSDPRWINKKGCVISCGSQVNVDGIIPDDMRRGGSCQPNPLQTGYPWEGLQGFVMAARILDRAGLGIWQESDRAICRAASALQDGRFGSGWRAKGDDEWQLPFLDSACGTNWSASYGTSKWTAGKNAGWGYVLP